MRDILALSLTLTAIVIGCGDDTPAALPSPDPERRAACAASDGGTGPRLPFLALRTTELVLPLGELPSELAFDYRGEFPFWVTSLNVAYDFDRTVMAEPVAIAFETACPASIQMAEISVGLPNEGVFTGLLTATDMQTGSVRETRLTFTRGDTLLTLELPDVPDEDRPAWVLYEPAQGRSRVAIAPAQWGAVIQVEGLPAGLAEVAVVSADAIVLDDDDDAIYAPDDFGETWRGFVSPWFGAVVDDSVEDAVKLTEIRGVSEPADALPAVGSRQEFPENATSILLSVIDPSVDTTVVVPCPANTLQATVFGFAEVTDGEESAARGEPLKVPVECEMGTVEVDLSITVQNQRVATLRLELVE